MPTQRRRRGREAMAVRLDLNGLLAGPSTPAGITGEDLGSLERELAAVRKTLADRRRAGGLAFAELPHDQAHVRTILEAAEQIRDRFDTMVVLGTGASAGGPRALVTALGDDDENAVVVSDAIDPAAVRALLGDLDLERTIFDVASKSGESAETIARFLIVRDRLLRELGAVDYKKHLIMTTGTQRGSLRQIVNDEGFRALDVPAEVPSRFGIFSGIGLLPAAVAGIDVEDLLAGARAMDERMAAAETLADPAFVLAGALFTLARRAGRQRLLVMPFSERLGPLASWFCRLWTETLATVPGAQTPVVAAASADRHAHARVLADARRDATVLFVRVEDHGEALDIPAAYQDIEGIGSVGGNSLGTLLNAEQRATERALAREGGLSATVTLPALNPYTVGQVVVLLQMVTVVYGVLAGTDPVAPIFHDQREQILQALLGRAGTEAQRAELDAWVAAKDPRFVI